MQCTKKLIIIFITLIAIVLCMNASVSAKINPDDYNPTEISPISGQDSETAIKIIGKILATIKVVGVCISVVILTIIGLKYMICSIDEKATYKENMVPYVVGCFLLASATTIPSIVFDLVNK